MTFFLLTGNAARTVSSYGLRIESSLKPVQTTRPHESPPHKPKHTGTVHNSEKSRQKARHSSVKFRTIAGSTGIPGPVVVETVTFLR